MFAFEKIKEVDIKVSLGKVSMCTIKKQQQQQKKGAPLQLERLQEILNFTQIYKHCQISVTQNMIMTELSRF